jgi:hypothetical protein
MTDIAIKELLSELVSLPRLGLLHYLLTKSEGKHIAHCLDLDLVASGQSCEEAAVNLDSLVKAHIELALAIQQHANLSTKAPQSFWDQFADGKSIELEPRTLHIQIPESVQIVPVSESKLRILARVAHAA